MRVSMRASCLFPALAACLIVGCSEKPSGPDKVEPPAAMTQLWSAGFGDHLNQWGSGVAVDASKNIIVTGGFEGSMDLGGGRLTSAGNDDVFLAKLDLHGGHIWSKRFGGASFEQAFAVAVDGSGNIIVTGELGGAADFGGGPITGGGFGDIFLAKFAPGGAHIWSKGLGGESLDQATSVAVDASGNVILAGYFRGTTDLGGGPLVSAGNDDAFIAKFDPDGNHLWSKRFGDDSDQVATAVAADASGNVIVTGSFYGSLDLGGGSLASAGYNDVFVAKFSPSGGHVWGKRFGDANVQYVGSVAVDASGNVVIAGNFRGTIAFGGGALSCEGYEDMYLAKLGPTGGHLWSKRFGNSGVPRALSVAVDASRNILVTGGFDGAVDFGGGALTSAGDDDIFIARFAPNGSWLWSARLGDEAKQYGRCVAVDGSGSAVLIGTITGTASRGGQDAFLAKFGLLCDGCAEVPASESPVPACANLAPPRGLFSR